MNPLNANSDHLVSRSFFRFNILWAPPPIPNESSGIGSPCYISRNWCALVFIFVAYFFLCHCWFAEHEFAFFNHIFINQPHSFARRQCFFLAGISHKNLSNLNESKADKKRPGKIAYCTLFANAERILWVNKHEKCTFFTWWCCGQHRVSFNGFCCVCADFSQKNVININDNRQWITAIKKKKMLFFLSFCLLERRKLTMKRCWRIYKAIFKVDVAHIILEKLFCLFGFVSCLVKCVYSKPWKCH